MDASNMLKPALARGQLRVVGATTLDEYRKHIEKDAALARRFQPVLVRRAERRGHRGDPARAAGQLRGAPPGADHRRGAGRRGGAVRPLHHRPVPAGQGDRPDRPGRRPGAAAGQDPGGRRARAGAAPRAADAATGTRRSPPRTTRRRPQLRDEINELRERRSRRATATTAASGVPQVTAGGHRRGGLAGHRHPGRAAHRGGAGAAAAPGGAPARAGDRPGRRGRRGRRGGPAVPGRAGRPGPAGGQLPVPRPDRGRQDRAGADAGRGAVRRRRTGWSGWT